PHTYIHSNLTNHINILKLTQKQQIHHLIYTSSSSIYNNNKNLPFHIKNHTNHPISLYTTTKQTNKLIKNTHNKYLSY
ncbi:protein CapI, partial [Enterococcus hirae]